MSEIHNREMLAMDNLAESSERMGRVVRANVRVTAAVLAADRALIPDDVWRAAKDAEAVTQESA